MDVKIKKKSKTKEIQLLKSQDFHLKKHTRLIRLIGQELQRLTCLKTTRDGRMKRESTQGSTRISQISSPSIFLAQRRSTKLMLNFVTSFTLIDDENRNLPGRRDANAIKEQISIFLRLFWVFKKGQSTGNYHRNRGPCQSLPILKFSDRVIDSPGCVNC